RSSLVLRAAHPPPPPLPPPCRGLVLFPAALGRPGPRPAPLQTTAHDRRRSRPRAHARRSRRHSLPVAGAGGGVARLGVRLDGLDPLRARPAPPARPPARPRRGGARPRGSERLGPRPLPL